PFVARRGRDAARAVSTGRPSGMSPALNSWPRHYGGLSACGVGGGRVEAARAAEPRRRRTRCRLPSRSILRRRGDLVFGATVNLTKGIIGRLAREAADLGQPVVSCGGEEEEEEEEDSLYVSVVWCSSTVGGLGLGLVSLVATGFLALLGFLAIGYACRHTGARTYREACVRSAGVHPLLVDVMVVLECIITNVGYTLLILDYANIGLNGLFGLPVNRLSRTLLAVLITASAILPLSLKENLYSLRFSSLLGVFAVGYALVFVIADSATQESCWDFFDGASFVGSEREGIFRAVSIMTSALSFHYNAPTIWAELSDHPSQWNAFVTASILSFSICTVIYVAFSIAGLACFGSTVQGNVLMGYQPGVLVLLAWIAQSVNLTVCFPLVFKPARDTLMQSVGFPPPSSQGQGQHCRTLSPWTASTAAVVLCVVGAATTLTDISRVQASRKKQRHESIIFRSSERISPWRRHLAPPLTRSARQVGRCQRRSKTSARNSEYLRLHSFFFLPEAFRGALLGAPLCFMLPGHMLAYQASALPLKTAGVALVIPRGLLRHSARPPPPARPEAGACPWAARLPQRGSVEADESLGTPILCGMGW
ncbi:unnamed protein product, partial [Prorocentrum cordatum]